MKILKALVGWFRRGTAARPDANGRAADTRRQVERATKELEAAKRKLDERQQRIEKEFEQYRKEAAAAKQAADRAMGLNKKLQTELDGKDQQLAIANEIVIPNLVAANATFKELWGAETAQHIKRQVDLGGSTQG